MTAEQIIAIVKDVTGISYMHIVLGEKKEEIRAKYLIVVLLRELDYKPKEIAAKVGIERCSVYWALKTIDVLLQIDKGFKELYFACGDRIAELEEREEQQCA
jgi:sulfur carrier protein ThiS